MSWFTWFTWFTWLTWFTRVAKTTAEAQLQRQSCEWRRQSLATRTEAPEPHSQDWVKTSSTLDMRHVCFSDKTDPRLFSEWPNQDSCRSLPAGLTINLWSLCDFDYFVYYSRKIVGKNLWIVCQFDRQYVLSLCRLEHESCRSSRSFCPRWARKRSIITIPSRNAHTYQTWTYTLSSSRIQPRLCGQHCCNEL